MIKTLSILLLVVGVSSPAFIDKISFYKTFESNSEEKIEKKLSTLEKLSPSTNKDAFIGALIMKKSQFMKTPKEKASIFKEGKALLEKAIKAQPNNAEYRFLRFAIQENVPKILKYNANITEDKDLIIKSFRKLDPTLRKVIKEYAKQSKGLSVEQLK